MQATIRWSDEDGFWLVEDEYGSIWRVVQLDGRFAAVERDTQDGYEAGEFVSDPHLDSGWLYAPRQDGSTWTDGNEEYEVVGGRWLTREGA